MISYTQARLSLLNNQVSFEIENLHLVSDMSKECLIVRQYLFFSSFLVYGDNFYKKIAKYI